MAHMYHRGQIAPPPPANSNANRIAEYLENMKNEFENMSHEVTMYKAQRDEFERKLTNQLNEFTTINQTIYELEKSHQRIKAQYEEEIIRLRRQLEAGSQGGPAGNAGNRDLLVARENLTSLSNASVYRPSSPVNSGNTSAPAPAPIPHVSTQMGSGPPLTAAQHAANQLAANQQIVANQIAAANQMASQMAAGQHMTPAQIRSSVPAGPQGSSAAHSSQKSSSAPSDRERGVPYPTQGGPPGAILNPGSGPTGPAPVAGARRQRANDEYYGGQTGEPKAKVEKREDSSAPPPSLPGYKEGSRSGNIALSILRDKDSAPLLRDDAEADGSKPGPDWIVGYNPSVQTNLNIDLSHTLHHNSVVCCVRFSNDGKYLATGCNKSAQIYDVESGRKVHTFIDDCAKEDLYIRSVCFSPNGQHLATGAEDKTVKLWDITHKKILLTCTSHELDIYSVDFSADGRFMVSGSGDKRAKIWDVDQGRCAFTLGNDEVGPKDGITSVAISPDCRLVAAGSLDRIVRLWDAQTGYFLERFEGHSDSVYSVAFSPDGKSLASGSLDKTLKLWDLSGLNARSRCRATFTGHKDFVLSVAFSPEGNWLISGSKDRSVQFWDPRSAVTHMMLQGHKNSVLSVVVSPAGGYFATGGGDSRARIWKYEA